MSITFKITNKEKFRMFLLTLDLKKVLKVIFICLIGVACCFTLSTTGAYQVFYGGTLKKLPIYSVKTENKQVAISFDCAWGDEYTDTLLQIMEEENVKCTFFMVEFWAKKYPEHVKKIDEMGHEIGTHSATHPHMSKLSKSAIEKELSTSIKAITDITNKKVEVFRPPFGDYNDRLIEVAKSLNLYTIQWSVDSLDWKNLSAEEITERVLLRTGNGDIVLFHNNGLHTAKALRPIIKALKGKGYEFKRIGDLIYRENYTIDVNGCQVPSG